ncbi:hypothetical protein [Streptomonospora litoralis]|uniref:Uncharacterized protein n=1 Tax=Streptomonospora litoralis TaxID=2498135 RepID=A0A4P6PYV3_9ACTN|nr:hypothetical protein [Streptomonospora litoralis]QBI53313.1 hypothetical protein EKD16_07585 [Streptomonospora litoralis]
MTEPPDDAFEERLRALLRAEADSVDPSPEALNAIRSRTQRGSNWFSALLNASWLRPSLAVGAAAVIAGSVLLGTPQVRDQILPQSLTTPAEEHEPAPERGEGGPGQDEDDVSGKAEPEPDPADRPSGGAEPTRRPPEPESTGGSAAPFGTTQHCAGSAPPPTPAPSPSPGTTQARPGGKPGAPDSECESTDEPTVPTEEPSQSDPGDGSTGGSTPPPGDGDQGADGTTPPTTGPENGSSGTIGSDPVLETD